MPIINSIHLNLQTGNESYAGTDGDVFLGLCGREFFIDTSSDDFERGAKKEYVLGEASNIRNAAKNDPRVQKLFTEKVANFPVYIRFAPKSRTDEWQLQRADVRLNDSFHIDWDTANFVDQAKGIWLGIQYGLIVHLEGHTHDPVLKKAIPAGGAHDRP